MLSTSDPGSSGKSWVSFQFTPVPTGCCLRASIFPVDSSFGAFAAEDKTAADLYS